MIHTVEEIIALSFPYNLRWGVNNEDVKKANLMSEKIEASRNDNSPVAGDTIICVGPKKEYSNGIIQSYGDTISNSLPLIICDNLSTFSICTQPMIPFVFLNLFEDDILYYSISGGYWLSEPLELGKNLELVERKERQFKSWGHEGPRRDGAFYFKAKVNVWKLYSDQIY